MCVEETVTKNFLVFVQHKLFNVSSYLATDTENPSVERTCRVTDDDITLIEKEIDRLDMALPKLSRFILPGGNEVAARAHICRTVCRRAERKIFRLNEKYPVDQRILSFINRLSDYFSCFRGMKISNRVKKYIVNNNIHRILLYLRLL